MVTFLLVAETFQKIERCSSRNEITQILASLMKMMTPEEAKIVSYLSLGELRAVYQGTQFNFAEKSLIKFVAQVLACGEDFVMEQLKSSGDLGTVLMNHGQWFVETPVTLLELYDNLVVFEKLSGEGSNDEKFRFLKKLIVRVDPLSAGYIVRIIVGKLRLGFLDMTLIDALSWVLVNDKSLRNEIEHAYNISADIGRIAYIVKEGGIAAIKNLAVQLGIPIRPAAAERLSSSLEVIQKIGPCAVQVKLDGFRLQVHIDRRDNVNQVWFFSRNLLNMTPMFPDIARAFHDFDCESLIVEGEALAFDEYTRSYLPFQETVKRRRKHDIDSTAGDIPLKLVLFDILYWNGQTFLAKPQRQRYAFLHDIFKNFSQDLITVVDEKICTSTEQLEDYFAKSIATGLEGVVVKKLDAPYQPGKRNFNWIKLKREERGHLDDTIDAVVLGYYYGMGRRAQFGIGAFLVGLYNASHDSFETVAKIGTGLSDTGWIELKSLCDVLKVVDQPYNVVCNKDLIPDVWVSPKLVVIVRADEITKSPVHSAGKLDSDYGLGLRFPRIMGYREDKSLIDITTVTELQALFNLQKK